MKAKFLAITAAAAALLLSACQRNELGGGSLSGEEVTVGISAVMPLDGGAVVKSDAEPGKGDEVNRCIMQVYLADDTELSNATEVGELKTVEVTDGKASFGSLQLVAGHTYRLVLWADCATKTSGTDGATASFSDLYYNTGNYPEVSFKDVEYAGNDDSRDAFFASYELKVDGPSNRTVELHRPFGQLNIITSDYSVVETSFPALVPEKVSLTFSKVPQGINLLTGALAETFVKPLTGVSVDVAAVTEPAAASGSKHLSFDYIFAPEGDQYSIPEITMSFDDAEGNEVASNYKFVNLPVQRNYRTNVTGALLTDRTGIDIEVVSDFDETKEISEEVTSEESAQDALNAGFTDIVFTEPIEKVSLTLPENSNADYNIAFSAGVSGNVTISSNTYTGHLSINCNGQATDVLTVDIPQGTATIDDGEWASVTATTAKNTVIVGENAIIETLNIISGNVEVYGEVSEIKIAEGVESVVTVYVRNNESFKNAMSLAVKDMCDRIILTEDVDVAMSSTYVIKGEGNELIIDLSDKELNITSTRTVVDVMDYAEVTIQNGSLKIWGIANASGTSALYVSNNGTITLDGLIYRTTSSAVAVSERTDGGKIYVNDCDIDIAYYDSEQPAGNGFVVATNADGADADNPTNVYISLKDSKLKAYSTVVLFNLPSRIDIENCELESLWQAMVLRGGTAKAVNSTFTNRNNSGNDSPSTTEGYYETEWSDGNKVPRAALTVGNRSSSYQYRTSLTMKGCTVQVVEGGANKFAAMYVYANQTEGMGVSIDYDSATTFEGGKVIYASDNITVNEEKQPITDNK